MVRCLKRIWSTRLAERRGYGEDDEVEVHLGRRVRDEAERGLELLSVDERDEREDHRERVHAEHHVERRDVLAHSSHTPTQSRAQSGRGGDSDSVSADNTPSHRISRFFVMHLMPPAANAAPTHRAAQAREAK